MVKLPIVHSNPFCYCATFGLSILNLELLAFFLKLFSGSWIGDNLNRLFFIFFLVVVIDGFEELLFTRWDLFSIFYFVFTVLKVLFWILFVGLHYLIKFIK